VAEKEENKSTPARKTARAGTLQQKGKGIVTVQNRELQKTINGM